MKSSRREDRALAKVENRPSAGSSVTVMDDPIRVGLDKTIVIDMSKLQTPSNVYDADVSWIEHHPGDARLFFAKRSRADEKMLRSRLELRYPPESLVGHFWRNSREFHRTMKLFAAKWPQEPSRDELRPEGLPSAKEHSEWVNFEVMAHAGTEAVLDFYSLPPSGIAIFTRGQGSHGLRMVPIVRVQMTIFELTRLLDSLEPIIAAIEAYLPPPDHAFAGETK